LGCLIAHQNFSEEHIVAKKKIFEAIKLQEKVIGKQREEGNEMQEQHMQDKFVYGFRLYTYGVLCYKSVVDQMHESLGFEAGNLLARGVTQDDAEDIYNSVLN